MYIHIVKKIKVGSYVEVKKALKFGKFHFLQYIVVILSLILWRKPLAGVRAYPSENVYVKNHVMYERIQHVIHNMMIYLVNLIKCIRNYIINHNTRKNHQICLMIYLNVT